MQPTFKHNEASGELLCSMRSDKLPPPRLSPHWDRDLLTPMQFYFSLSQITLLCSPHGFDTPIRSPPRPDLPYEQVPQVAHHSV